MDSPSQSNVDVLIVGAGPAGLMLALWLSRLGVKTRIVDKRTDKVFSGQADGFQARTLEILDSFGIGERIWKEANKMYEVCFWNPDEKGVIRCSNRAPNNAPGLSRFTEAVLHQGRVETFFTDAIRDLKVERKTMPTSLFIDETKIDDEDAYPVTVTLRRLSEEEATPAQRLSNLRDGLFRSNLVGDEEDVVVVRGEGKGQGEGGEEVVRAKYVVGCDGAHSWTRKSLGEGFEMRGEMTDHIWGVLDIVPITDFPDIRTRCIIHSASSGSLMIIPRENKLVRLYIQLTEVSSSSSSSAGRVDRSKITQEMIFKAAKKIISPYKLDYYYCDWWTAYQIGQRSGERFSKHDRVFLAGDAVHTHSPKAGQGMNVSMQDTYNLGWKLGLVCKKAVQREILSTYEFERKKIAKELIAFDQKFSSLFSGRPAKDVIDETGVSMEELKEAFDISHMFTSGIGVTYNASALTSTPPPPSSSSPLPAKNCKPGTRFPSFQVLAQSDASPWQMHHKMPSDGRFRIVVFAGDITLSTRLDLVNNLGDWLEKTKLLENTSIVDILLVHTSPRAKVQIVRDLHRVYHPFDERLGWDYDKVLVDGESYTAGHGRAYEGYGVDPEVGALVVVRPDGYVGLVTGLEKDGWEEVDKWFKGVLRFV
ncbi:FAD binding domain-containing protein [Poronia punctata]|nr:FAD binding domain-containing protein [Poronia punctata]